MRIENSWIRFEENGERITGKKGRIRTNRNDKLYFELLEVEGEGTCRININDYLSNRINHLDAEYVTIVCKDYTRNFVEVREADEHPSWIVHDDAPSTAFDEVSSHLMKRELFLSIARVVKLYDKIEYRDEEVEEKIVDLQQYLELKLGV